MMNALEIHDLKKHYQMGQEMVRAIDGINLQRTEKKFKIIGIIERQPGLGGMGMFAAVMIPLTKARQMRAYDISSP